MLKIQLDKNIILLTCLIFLSTLIIYFPYVFGNAYYVFNDLGADTYHGYLPFMFQSADIIENRYFYSFNISIGSYSLLTKQLYDPFNWILYLFGKEYIFSLLVYITILKHIFAGIFFYNYLSYFKFDKKVIFIISFAYALSGYIIVWGQHYHFGTMFVLFSLYLWAFERFLEIRKYILLIVTLCFFYTVNLLLLYVSIIFIIVYGTIRIIQKKKKYFYTVIQIIFLYIIAFLLSAWIVIPDILNILQSPRTEASYFSFYTLFEFVPNINEHILVSILKLFSNDIIGMGYNQGSKIANYYSLPTLYSTILILFLSVLSFYIAYKNKRLFHFIAILSTVILFLIDRFFVGLLNGFNNIYFFRFSIFYTFVIYLAAAYGLQYIEQVKKKDIFISFVLLLIVVCSVFFSFYHFYSLKHISNFNLYILYFVISLIIIYFLIVFNKQDNKNILLKILFIILFIEVSISGYISVNYDRKNITTVTQKTDKYFDKDIQNLIDNENRKNIPYRVLNNYSSLNSAMIYGYPGLNSYLSLNNSKYMQFLNELEQHNYLGHPNFIMIDSNRINLIKLLGTKYIISKVKLDNRNLKLVFSDNKKFIYSINNEFIKFYDKCIPKSYYDTLNWLDKQQLLNNFCTQENLPISKVEFTQEYDFKLFKSLKPQIRNTKIIDSMHYMSTNDDPMFIYKLKQKKSLSTLVTFNLNIKKNGTLLVYYRSKGESFTDKQRVAIKLKRGYSEYKVHVPHKNIEAIRIDPINWKDNFSFDSLCIKQFYKIKEKQIPPNKSINKGLNIKYNIFNYDKISGIVDVKRNGVLFFPILFDKDWKLYIDGIEVPIYEINTAFIGAKIKQGKHTFKLIYSPYYHYILFIISMITFIGLIVMFFLNKKRVIK